MNQYYLFKINHTKKLYISLVYHVAIYTYITNYMKMRCSQYINPLLPSVHKSARICKIYILKLEGTIQKISMSVATMSR